MTCQKYANKVGMMHESKGQHFGKVPFLHLFTLQLDSMLQSWIRTLHPCSYQCCKWVFEFYTLITMTSLQPTQYIARQFPEACDKSATVNTSSMLAIKLLGSYLIATCKTHTHLYSWGNAAKSYS